MSAIVIEGSERALAVLYEHVDTTPRTFTTSSFVVTWRWLHDGRRHPEVSLFRAPDDEEARRAATGRYGDREGFRILNVTPME